MTHIQRTYTVHFDPAPDSTRVPLSRYVDTLNKLAWEIQNADRNLEDYRVAEVSEAADSECGCEKWFIEEILEEESE